MIGFRRIKTGNKVAYLKYDFSQVLYINNAGNPFGFNNPFTTKRYVATIDGKADIGLNVNNENLKTEVHDEKNESGNKIC